MCGIFGWVMHPAQLTPGNIEAARRATGRLTHRGPDHGGEWLSGSVYMGHRRLSIIDLSDAANQPFSGPSGRYVLSFNGEIYNYLELRATLGDIPQSTQSDCEPPLHLYRRDGLSFTDSLRGMYAIAIHDPAEAQLILARDPFGIKPLYMSKRKTILRSPRNRRHCSPPASRRPNWLRSAGTNFCSFSSPAAAARSSRALTESFPARR